MNQHNPQAVTGEQCNEKARLAFYKAATKGIELLSQETFSPDRLSALAAFMESCASNEFDEGQADE